MALPDLDTKTMPPIKHAERFEFGDDNWIAAAHAFLEPRVAEHANELNGKRLVVQETYPNAPPHLNQPDNILNLHYIFDSSALTLGHGPVDNPTIHMQADYNLGHIVNATVYEVIPGRQARIMRELNHRHGKVFDIKTSERPPEVMGKIFAGIHDHLARRIVSNPNVDHRVKHLGVAQHLDELDTQGYTVVENAISHEFADELAADLHRLFEENENSRRVASMLLARGPLWQELAVHPLVHTIAQKMLGADCNMGQSLGFSKPKGLDTHQLHNDPPHPLTGELCCNLTTIWALEDFTETSGSTLVVPGSHKQNCRPAADAASETQKILMPKGSVAMWHGSLWHGAAIRADDGERISIHNTYLRNWVRTFDDYLTIDPEVLVNNAPAITTLAGVDDIYMKNTIAGPDNRRYQ